MSLINQKEDKNDGLFDKFYAYITCRKKQPTEKGKKRKEKVDDKLLSSEEYQKEYQLRQFLKKKQDEQLKIDKAKYHWSIVRRKVFVIKMISNTSGEMIFQMYKKKKEKQ